MNPSSTPSTVTVIGFGRTSVTPDLLVLRLSINETRSVPYDAELALKERRKRIREAFDSIDLDPSYLRSEGGAAVFPVYKFTRDGSEFIGFRATENVVVRMPLNAIAQTDLLTVLTPVSGDSRIQIDYEASDPASARLGALAAAVGDARKNADVIAEAAGASLGDLLRITHPPHADAHNFEVHAMKADEDFAPDEQFETAKVEAVWALHQKF